MTMSTNSIIQLAVGILNPLSMTNWIVWVAVYAIVLLVGLKKKKQKYQYKKAASYAVPMYILVALTIHVYMTKNGHTFLGTPDITTDTPTLADIEQYNVMGN